jgi:DHA3 family multidrug efflux protein-like MFS transporter
MHNQNLFPHILINTAIAGFTNMLLWFAITFWSYLTTHSVFVTGVLGGVYLVLNLLSGLWFGSLVDHHRKKLVMLGSSAASLLFYLIGFALLTLLPSDTWGDTENVWLWVFILTSMLGIVSGNIRMIALSTMVTMLIPEEGRAKANGQIGAVNGLTFSVVSVFSGLVVGRLGMDWAVGISIVSMIAVMLHLMMLTFPSESHLDDRHEDEKKVDIRGTIKVIA